MIFFLLVMLVTSELKCSDLYDVGCVLVFDSVEFILGNT